MDASSQTSPWMSAARTTSPPADNPLLPFEGDQPTADTWTRAASGENQDFDTSNLDHNPRLRVIRGFPSRFLDCDRDILIWLPAAYGLEPERRFPVLYLQDGQNLFDGRTSYVPGSTWRAHTTADRVAREGSAEPTILVGVAHTGMHRMADYTPSRDPRFGGGDGRLYARLLIEELKPVVDANLRTRPEAEYTGIAGSSLGGLISLDLGLRCPDVFSRLGVLSPSVWWNGRAILTDVGKIHPCPLPRVWLDMGTAEGLRHLRDADLLAHRLLARGWRLERAPADGGNLRYLRVHGGLHSEDHWSRRFDQVLRFLFPVCT